MAEEVKAEFYVTLFSNASMNYFPQNTQSLFRTKLSAPLVLSEDYEVGLTEMSMPRNWFNIGTHNNSYKVVHATNERVLSDYLDHEIPIDTVTNEDAYRFCERVNRIIETKLGRKESVVFLPNQNQTDFTIQMESGFEARLTVAQSSKLLYMFQLPQEDTSYSSPVLMKYKPTTSAPVPQVFIIRNKNPKNIFSHIIPLIHIKDDSTPRSNATLFEAINKNIQLLSLQDFLSFSYDIRKAEVTITINPLSELVFEKKKCSSLMEKLNISDDVALAGTRTFSVQSIPISLEDNETVELKIKDLYERNEEQKLVHDLTLDIGQYKTADTLLRSFRFIHLAQLPSKRVKMHVPDNYELELCRELANMLGFEQTIFASGLYESRYNLELDGGISEILIYSDLIASHHVGDSFAPLLRVIPCMSEKEDQIVKHFQNPLYFALRKYYIDTIEIELKSSSGQNIIFSGGKTHLVLSFRRKYKF